MIRIIARLLLLSGGILVSSVVLWGQSGANFGAAAPASGSGSSGVIHSYFYPTTNWCLGYGYGWGGYFSPFLSLPLSSPPYPYMPNYWWVSPYPLADPRQDGFNPAGGYPRETVTTLLLTTNPEKSRVTLDGIFVGTSDKLGPFQLPVGEHTLRVEAAGYEPSETVLKVEQPTLEQLDIRLTPRARPTQPAPRS